MSHETTHHHDAPHSKGPKTPIGAAFFFVAILAGLFIAAVNFTNVMGHDDEGHGGGHGETTHEATTHGASEHEGGTINEPKEASSNETLHGETGAGKPVEEHEGEHHEAAGH